MGRGGSNIGQKTSGRITKILPTRQTHSENLFLSKLSMSKCPEPCAEKTDQLSHERDMYERIYGIVVPAVPGERLSSGTF